ncbi:MAG: aminotransferase class V-fold PLP-dependent enzyme [Planctomycetota bacterium]
MANSLLARHWRLDPAIDFLNHGSFGACPRPVLAIQREWVDRLEREPVRFMARELEEHLDRVRAELGEFMECHPDDLALVPNATHALNTVLRSLELRPDDELLVTDHEYNASANILDFVAARAGARVVKVDVPFPLDDPRAVSDLILAAVTERTRLLLIDHVTSQTGLVLPIEPLVQELRARGVETLVDGAHAPGMVPLELDALGAAYYTGNLHKWVCAPKGSAFLYVRRDKQADLRPLAISHGANSTRTDRSRFRLEADWLGTVDPSPWLAIPAALDFVRNLVPGGLHGLREHNRDLVLEGRRLLCETLGVPAPAPESMIGSLASVPLPTVELEPEPNGVWKEPLHQALLERSIEVPTMLWPAPPRRLLRISAQAYNHREQYERLADAVAELTADSVAS